MESSLKRCTVCKSELPVSAFGWQNRERAIQRTSCRECDAHAGDLFGITDEYEARRAARLFLQYGLSPEDEKRLLSEQNGSCATCGCIPESRRLKVDYVESTGEVRGLLCDTCKKAVGWVGKNVAVMQRTVAYLTRHQRGSSSFR